MARMGKKIKVLHLITRLDKGGSAESTLLTILGLGKNGYENVLAKGPSTESQMSLEERTEVERLMRAAQSLGARIITIPCLFRRIAPIYDFLSFLKVLGIIRREKPTIVHTHTSKAGVVGRVAALMARAPIIVHTPHGHVFYQYFGRTTTWIFALIEKLLARISDKIISLTDREELDHIRFKIASPEKFIIIHSGVDIRKFTIEESHGERLRRSLGIGTQSLVVGTVGRLVPVKGHKYLVEAAPRILREVPNVKFVVVGNGYLKPILDGLTRELNVQDAFLFLDWRSDIPETMGMFELFVLPSLNEGMGRVLVEAMAARKAIIASDTGGIPDMVIHGHNGLLVPPEDSSRLAEAIITLLKDSHRREEMGRNGRLLAQRYSVESMVNKIDALYETLLTQKGYVQV